MCEGLSVEQDARCEQHAGFGREPSAVLGTELYLFHGEPDTQLRVVTYALKHFLRVLAQPTIVLCEHGDDDDLTSIDLGSVDGLSHF